MKAIILTRKQTMKLMPCFSYHYKNISLFINAARSKSIPLVKFVWDRRLGYSNKRY